MGSKQIEELLTDLAVKGNVAASTQNQALNALVFLYVEMSRIVVRHGKGGKDRVTVLPGNASEALRAHLTRVRAVHEGDCGRGYGHVNLPGAITCIKQVGGVFQPFFGSMG